MPYQRPLIPLCYSVPRERTSPKWCNAFATGCGGGIVTTKWLMKSYNVAMFGSPVLWDVLTEAKKRKMTWYYGDHAYFGRWKYYRCTKNAAQHTGLDGDTDPARFLAFNRPIKPWRKSGGHIVLAPNSPAFLRLNNLDAKAWVHDVTRRLKLHTDREVRLRWVWSPRPLAVDLVGAWALVTYTSNSAVEAAIAGVPVFALGECPGRTIGTNDLSLIESPLMPDNRLEWASTLANNQWTFGEMAAGMAWSTLK
jgi:hypothetical protein